MMPKSFSETNINLRCHTWSCCLFFHLNLGIPMQATRLFVLSLVISFLVFSNSYGQIKASFNPPIYQGYVGTVNYGTVSATKTSDKFIIIHRTDTSAGTMTCTITPPSTSTYSIINHALTFTIADTTRDTITI